MAKNYDGRTAHMLIARHSEFRNKLQTIENAQKNYAYELSQVANLDKDSGLFDSNMFRELTGQPSLDNRNNQLILAIYKYMKYCDCASEASQIRNVNESNIKSKEEALSASLGLRRLFKSSSAKAAADLAYDELSQLANGLYAQQINSLNERFLGLSIPSQNSANDEFAVSKNSFKDALKTAVPEIFDSKYTLQAIAFLDSRLQNLKDSLSKAQSLQESLRQSVKACIDRLVTVETLNIMRTLPIEQINQLSSGGIRVKTLREHGYTTMADIYTAKQYELALIQGISDDGASTIKHCAKQCAKKAMEAVKLKINADNRDADSTALVVAAYKYRHNLMETAIAAGMMRDAIPKVSSGIASLRNVGSTVNWFFFEKEQKDSIASIYKEIQSLLYSQFSTDVERHLAAAQDTTANEATAWDDFIKNSIQYFQLFEEIAPGLFGQGDSDYGLPEDLAKEIQEEAFFPDGLKCDLRRYQEWGVKYILHQERVLLGDEMGLGKTVQAIATMVSLRNTGATHFIVVCPASVLPNWYKEVLGKSKLKAFMVYGPSRKQAINAWINIGGVAVTNYETTGFFALDTGFKYDMLTVDEAHYIKNADAQRSKNVRELASKANRILYMTGTPLENNVDEMITLIKDLNPSIAYAAKQNSMLITAPAFRDKIVPVYYRRKRTDVLTELPELIENKEWCIMTPQETKVYESAVLARKYADARRVSWNVGNLGYSSKAQRLKEIIAEAEEDNRKILVFSFFLDTIDTVRKMLGDKCMQPINGSVPIGRRQEIIDEFEAASAGTVLLAQIQSGGTGLNIQSASVVVICEPQFKPSIENQAISRAYRMGQARNVFVHRLLCENSVDEKITDMLAQKQHIFDEFADKSVAAQESLDLDEKTFGNIIEEEIERIKAKQEHEQQSQAG